MEDARNIALCHDADALPDDYDERPSRALQELEELVRLRAELTWADWKAHPRFKKDRVIREAQRRMGVPAGDAPIVPAAPPANDVPAKDVNDPMADIDAELMRDAAFSSGVRRAPRRVDRGRPRRPAPKRATSDFATTSNAGGARESSPALQMLRERETMTVKITAERRRTARPSGRTTASTGARARAWSSRS